MQDSAIQDEKIANFFLFITASNNNEKKANSPTTRRQMFKYLKKILTAKEEVTKGEYHKLDASKPILIFRESSAYACALADCLDKHFNFYGHQYQLIVDEQSPLFEVDHNWSLPNDVYYNKIMETLRQAYQNSPDSVVILISSEIGKAFIKDFCFATKEHQCYHQANAWDIYIADNSQYPLPGALQAYSYDKKTLWSKYGSIFDY